VVDTTNFIGGKVAVGGAPYSDELHLVERFTRTDANTIDYEITVSDPKTFTRRGRSHSRHSRGRISDLRIRVSRGQQGHAESFERCPGLRKRRTRKRAQVPGAGTRANVALAILSPAFSR